VYMGMAHVRIGRTMSTHRSEEAIWHKTVSDGPSEIQRAMEDGMMVLIMPTLAPKVKEGDKR